MSRILLTFALLFIDSFLHAQHHSHAKQLSKHFTEIKAFEQNRLSGDLHIVGSSSMAPLIETWAYGFSDEYPKVNVSMSSKNSQEGFSVLSDTANDIEIVAMSRPLSQDEINHHKENRKMIPIQIPVVFDAVIVFVNTRNPLDNITLNQIDGVFSSTYKLNQKPISVWSDLYTHDDWLDKKIELFGRCKRSGTSQFFKEIALADGEYNARMSQLAHFSMVVSQVKADITAIGYSALAYQSDKVKVLSVGLNEKEFYKPTYENCKNGNYPLSRPLYFYINKNKDSTLNNITLEFLKYVLSEEGQSTAKEEGYFPISEEVLASMITRLEDPDEFWEKGFIDP